MSEPDRQFEFHRVADWAEEHGAMLVAKHLRESANRQFVIYYPPGFTFFDGCEVDNFDLAKSIMKKLLDGGSIVLPSDPPPIGTESPSLLPAWRIEILGVDNGFDWDWSEGKYRFQVDLRLPFRITDGDGKEYANVLRLSTITGVIEQTSLDYGTVTTVAPLPITVEQILGELET